MTTFAFLNGKLLKEEHIGISPNNRSFRYGDGCFETIKVVKGKIVLADYHFERLFASLQLLQFEPPSFFTADYLKQQIIELVKKNGHQALARVRLMVFRGDGGLYDATNHFPNCLIQSWALNPASNQLNDNGLIIDVFTKARKTCDDYSHLKSNNYLSYAMAALWAKAQHLNDALLLNQHNRLADSTIANIFMVQNGIVKTPALTEGSVAGVMRRYLLTTMKAEGIPIAETTIEVADLLEAHEVFLTNAIYGIKWVKQCSQQHYQQALAVQIHQQMIRPLFV